MAATKLDRKYSSQILITNPDGSVDQGVLADYKSEVSEGSQDLGPADLLEDDVVTEVVDIYLKHKRSFCTLLTIQLLVEVIFTLLEALYAKSAMKDVKSTQIEEVYSSLGSSNVALFYWIAAGVALGYGCVYYPLGFYSVKTRRLVWLEWFSYWAVAGVIAQMLTAYLHK